MRLCGTVCCNSMSNRTHREPNRFVAVSDRSIMTVQQKLLYRWKALSSWSPPPRYPLSEQKTLRKVTFTGTPLLPSQTYLSVLGSVERKTPIKYATTRRWMQHMKNFQPPHLNPSHFFPRTKPTLQLIIFTPLLSLTNEDDDADDRLAFFQVPPSSFCPCDEECHIITRQWRRQSNWGEEGGSDRSQLSPPLKVLYQPRIRVAILQTRLFDCREKLVPLSVLRCGAK